MISVAEASTLPLEAGESNLPGQTLPLVNSCRAHTLVPALPRPAPGPEVAG